MDFDFDNDIPKHRKKKVKASPPKSDHKHVYDKQVLFHWARKNGNEIYFSGFLCSICGKRDNVQFFELKNDGTWMTKEEILKKYKDLPIVEFEW